MQGDDRAVGKIFDCADVLLLRAAVRPVTGTPESEAGDGDEADYLRAAARDEALYEAVAVSSSSLRATIDKVVAGTPVPLKKLRRAVRAVDSYRLRMSSRATPFGVLAGVSAARFGDDPVVTWRGNHVKLARVDAEWLSAIVARLKQSPDALRSVRVVINDLAFVRGSRLVVPYRHDLSRGEQATRETVVNHTSAVRFVVARAQNAIRYADLEAALSAEYPSVSESVLTGLLVRLIGAGALLTELDPPSHELDPLGHVLSCLSKGAEHLSPANRALLAELEATRTALNGYAQTPLGASRASLAAVTEQMRQLEPKDHLLHVDLGLDVDVRLPETVRAEVEQATQTLWSMSALRPDPDFLVEYYKDFVERYSAGRIVPLKELLNADTGLGAPAGYRRPVSERRLRGQRGTSRDADELLLGIAQSASAAGEREVVLDGNTIAALSGEQSSPPTSFDVLAHLMADSLQSAVAGEFRLVLAGSHPLAGAFSGRFAPLLGKEADHIGDMVRELPARHKGAVRTQLSFPTWGSRAANVARTPRWIDHEVVLGSFVDQEASDALRLSDLGVTAQEGRLAVVSLRTGREIVATVPSMLALSHHAPNAARFLVDLAQDGGASCPAWNWGVAGSLPYLPRVRVGRTVIASARWKPTEPALTDAGIDFRQWRQLFDRWREQWNVPDHVYTGHGDHRIAVDLTRPDHVALIRREWLKHPSSVLTEPPAGGQYGTGWLVPRGSSAQGHAHEVVFSLVSRTPPQDRWQPPTLLREQPVFPPGSQWLYAKLYCTAATHGEVLSQHLPKLVAALPPEADKWFYLRYADDEPHLRLRFHAEPRVLSAEVLPALNAWMTQLSAQGIGSRLVLDTYMPEYERYGGIDAVQAAEGLFHADSQACLEQLRLLQRRQLPIDPLVLASANYADLASRLLGTEQGIHWFLQTASPGKDGTIGAAHSEARRFIDPADDWHSLRQSPGGEELLDIWDRRGPSVTAYADRLRTLATITPEQVLPSLLHMHHNRLIGIDRAGENRSLALTRAALLSSRHKALAAR